MTCRCWRKQLDISSVKVGRGCGREEICCLILDNLGLICLLDSLVEKLHADG